MNYRGFQRGVSPTLVFICPFDTNKVRVVITTALALKTLYGFSEYDRSIQYLELIPGYRATPSPAKPGEPGEAWRSLTNFVYLCEAN